MPADSSVYPAVGLPRSYSLTQRSTTWRVPYSSNSVLLTRIGDICFMGGNVKFNSSGQNNYTKAQEKLPEGYRPVIVNTPVAVFGGETTFICYGEANGTVTLLGNPNSAYAGMHRRMEDRRPDARRIASGHWFRRLRCLAVTPRVIARMRRSCRTRSCPACRPDWCRSWFRSCLR